MMGLALSAVLAADEGAQRRITFNDDWRFARFGPMPDGSNRPEPSGLEAPDATDEAWRTLNLPHDWGIEGPFRPELPNVTAKLPWAGIGWYRKHFEVPASDRGRRVFLDIDGAMSHAQVWCNGAPVGEWPYGYSSFRLELTGQIRFGETNVIAVRLDNPPASSRWYPGGGIYRNVWLVTTPPVHVAHWGVYITTPEVTRDRATIEVRTTVDNQTGLAATLTVRHEVRLESDAEPVAGRGEETGLTVSAGASADSRVQLTFSNPQLWDIESPHRYVLRTTVHDGDWLIDAVETPFGIRRITFDPATGFHLNGRRVRLHGVSLHHDLGPLGAAINRRAIERQLELLREIGCNAIRTAHNPPAPEVLELCDRMGFLVVNEAFDSWQHQARAWVPNDYARHFDVWHERDVRNFVRRDRNHPSVIMWCSGNEVREQVVPGGIDTALRLRRLFHEEDPTRPVTGNLDYPYAVREGFHVGFDVIGLSYKPHLYAETRMLVPDKPILGAESASTMSSRGEYFFPVTSRPPVRYEAASTAGSGERARDQVAAGLEQGDVATAAPAARNPGAFFPVTTQLGDGADVFQVGSYDLAHPPWSSTPDIEFAAQYANPFVLGEFVWTGFDYLGEPNPYDSARYQGYNHPEDAARITQAMGRRGFIPSRSTYFGIFDLTGFRKDRFYLYQARWRPELPMAHLLPHWNWPERVCELTPVHVYTSGDEAELFLNGRSLGRKKRGPDEYRLRWDDVRYEPGELRVVAYKEGRAWAEAVRRTTGPAVAVNLVPDRSELQADGQDLAFVTVSIRDDRGEVVPRASDRIRFQLDGPGEIVAVDNGDATRLESFQAQDCRAFNGLCLVIIRTQTGQPGEIRVRAEADGLAPASVTLRAVRARPQ